MSEKPKVREYVGVTEALGQPTLDLGDGIVCERKSRKGRDGHYLYQISHEEEGESVGGLKLHVGKTNQVTFEIAFRDSTKKKKFFLPTLQRVARVLDGQNFDLVTNNLDLGERAFWEDLAVRKLVKPLDLEHLEKTEYKIRPLEDEQKSDPPYYPESIQTPNAVVDRGERKEEKEKLRVGRTRFVSKVAVPLAAATGVFALSYGSGVVEPDSPALGLIHSYGEERTPSLYASKAERKVAAHDIQGLMDTIADPFRVDLTDAHNSRTRAGEIWENAAGSYKQFPRDGEGNTTRMLRVVQKDKDISYTLVVKADDQGSVIGATVTKRFLISAPGSNIKESIQFRRTDTGNYIVEGTDVDKDLNETIFLAYSTAEEKDSDPRMLFPKRKKMNEFTQRVNDMLDIMAIPQPKIQIPR